MSRLNWILTLSSINVLLVTAERFSITTKILLQPYNFLRLHELLQITTLILFTVILPALLLQIVTNNFKTLQTRKGLILFLLFISGIYFYSTGNGLHEVSSFNLNNFCSQKNNSSALCQTFFINDYYTGNIFYLFGGGLIVISLMCFEKIFPNKAFNKKEIVILVSNAIIYSFAIFAYAAFDKVLVGLIYSVIIAIIADIFFLKIRNLYKRYPFITYTALTYTLGSIIAVLLRFH